MGIDPYTTKHQARVSANYRCHSSVLRDKGGKMRRVAILALGAFALYLAVVSAPDVARYIKISRM
jgi:hypothetical protein